jgi:hypothetical protein
MENAGRLRAAVAFKKAPPKFHKVAEARVSDAGSGGCPPPLEEVLADLISEIDAFSYPAGPAEGPGEAAGEAGDLPHDSPHLSPSDLESVFTMWRDDLMHSLDILGQSKNQRESNVSRGGPDSTNMSLLSYETDTGTSVVFVTWSSVAHKKGRMVRLDEDSASQYHYAVYPSAPTYKDSFSVMTHCGGCPD